MKAARFSICLVLFLIVWGCAARPPAEREEIVWKGEVLVRGVTEIPEGRTLLIRPGTRVVFAFVDEDGDGWGDAGLLVKGRLLAQGTRSAPIVFEPQEESSRPGRWGEVRLEGAGPSSAVNCLFRGARWALHAHYTPLRVESSRFVDNLGGVKFRGDPVTIYSSSFTGNGTGVRYWESSPEIISNIFEGNGTGIFCRLSSPGTLVRGNNFSGSVDYHIKLGELQARDVDARFNHWGTSSERAIEEKLYHRTDVSYLGRVIFDPLVDAPFPLELTWGEPPRDGGERADPGNRHAPRE